MKDEKMMEIISKMSEEGRLYQLGWSDPNEFSYDYAYFLREENKKLKLNIEDAKLILDEILYLFAKNSTTYKNNVEIVGVYDRLKILEKKLYIKGDK